MGLAASQVYFLSLTSRKADIENDMTSCSLHKQSLLREMSNLSSEYNSKLTQKRISYYQDGSYKDMTYEYLMGYGDNNCNAILAASGLAESDGNAVSQGDNLILTDYQGRVVLSDWYVEKITAAGIKANENGTFSVDNKNLAKILEQINQPAGTTYEVFLKALNGETFTEEESEALRESLNAHYKSLNTTGTNVYGDAGAATSTEDKALQAIIDFYVPKLKAAGTNGYTTTYNSEISHDKTSDGNYISDALLSGIFHLEQVDDFGNYQANTSLTYFINMGYVDANTDSETRAEITAWYNAERDNISEKENYWDLELSNLSSELEAINTEINSVKSLIDDAISSTFDWGSG